MNNAKGGTMNGHPVTIREAILKAADHIEQNPERYDFSSCETPDCGTPGCMIGWIGHFAGVDYRSFRTTFGFDYCDIGWVIRTPEIFGGPVPQERWDFLMRYQFDAAAAATVMRLFADERFPAPATSIDTDATPNAVASWAGGVWTPERVRGSAELQGVNHGP
jgi:hypothetical protein